MGYESVQVVSDKDLLFIMNGNYFLTDDNHWQNWDLQFYVHTWKRGLSGTAEER